MDGMPIVTIPDFICFISLQCIITSRLTHWLVKWNLQLHYLIWGPGIMEGNSQKYGTSLRLLELGV
jgi:hypothetical protein